jgi:hypothetical protein
MAMNDFRWTLQQLVDERRRLDALSDLQLQGLYGVGAGPAVVGSAQGSKDRSFGASACR